MRKIAIIIYRTFKGIKGLITKYTARFYNGLLYGFLPDNSTRDASLIPTPQSKITLNHFQFSIILSPHYRHYPTLFSLPARSIAESY